MKGRRPKPKAIHVAEGTYRPDRHGDRADGTTEGQPVKPRGLKGPALNYWNRIVPRLVKTGLADSRDSAALGQLVNWWAAAEELRKRWEAGDIDVFNQWLNASKQWLQLADRFGLSPVARSKIVQVKKEKPVALNIRQRKA